jgi:hypothetical protein
MYGWPARGSQAVPGHVVTVAVGSFSDLRRNVFLGLLCIVGFLYGVPRVASNLALSAWETDLMQLVLAGCTCFFFLRGMRATRANRQTQVPDPASRRRKRYLAGGVALAAIGFMAVLLTGKNG